MSVKDAMLDAAKRVHHKFVAGIRASIEIGRTPRN